MWLRILIVLSSYTRRFSEPYKIYSNNSENYMQEGLQVVHGNDITKITEVLVTSFIDHFHEFANLLDPDENRRCSSDFRKIAAAVIRRETWPYKFVDASGKLPPGVTGGDLTWLGSYELCSTIHVADRNGSFISGRYCNVKIPVHMRDPEYVAAIGINFGLCLPSHCDTAVLKKLAKTVLRPTGVQIDEEYTFCHAHREEHNLDGYFIMAMASVIIVSSLVLAGSLLEIWLYWRWKSRLSYETLTEIEDSEPESSIANSEQVVVRDASEATVSDIPDGQQINYRSCYESYRKDFAGKYYFCGGFLVAFSLPWNLQKLWRSRGPTKTDENGCVRRHPLAALNGIRTISLMWIIYVHNFTFRTDYANNPVLFRSSAYQDWSFQLVRNGSFSVDTFFVMSGLLSCYIMIPEYKKVNTCVRKLCFWLNYSIHRFVRIAPCWFFVTILFTGLFPYLTDGPLYPQNPEANAELKACRDHWWVSFLNNWLKMDNPCMLWTWYLSNDYQFSVILTPIFISLLAIHWIPGILFATGLIVSAAIATFVLTYKYEFGPSPIPIASFKQLYAVPYTRWGSYAMGMLVAWTMLEMPIKVKQWTTLKRCLVSLAASLIAALLTLSALFGLTGYFAGTPPSMSNFLASLYAALSRPAWSIGIVICIYQCAFHLTPLINKFLCFSGFVIPAKLTYCAYLIHPVVIFYSDLSSKRTQSYDHSYLLFSFLAILTISYLMATIVSMCTEVPVFEMASLLRKRKTGSTEIVERG